MTRKNTSVRLTPDDEKRMRYVQAQLEKSTGITISMSDALIAGLRELERKLKSKEEKEQSKSSKPN